MWVPRFLSAPRVLLWRSLPMMATSIVMAIFLVLGPLVSSALALDATWDGDKLTANNRTYIPDGQIAADDQRIDGRDELTDHYIYTYTERGNPSRHHVIFLESHPPTNGATGTYIFYNVTTENGQERYSNPSSPEEVTVGLTPDALTSQNGESTTCDSSVFGGLGWILCTTSTWLGSVTDAVYKLLRSFLEVPAATTDPETGLYQLWGVARSVANVLFAIVFLIIIYSQITSVGISTYSIMSMLPRLIVGAILVNVSFWVAAVAIDASNVLGHSVYSVFDNVNKNMSTNMDVDWSALTAVILGGGALAGTIGFVAATGGSVAGLGFLLISALASVAFGLFVAIVILAARQAILTILLLISPLALVAYVLPGTQSWFNRWRQYFTTLLIFFPLFALLFGGSAVASQAIINNANGLLHIVIIGLAVQGVPLVITPLLIQFSSGILGKIAGIANSKHGLVDRTKNWAREGAEYHKDRAIGQKRTTNPFKMMARANNRAGLRRENRRAGYQAAARAMARGRYDRNGEWQSRRSWEKSDRFKRQAEGDLSVAEERDKTRFTELQAGVNTYTDPRIKLRENIARVTNSDRVQKMTGGVVPEIRSRDEVLTEPATRLAQETAISGLRSSEANRAVSEIVNAKILSSQELQARATGAAGSSDIMLAGLVAKERKDYADKVNAQDQLMRHFTLNSKEYQNLAMGVDNITKVKKDSNGNITSTYTFKITDEYVREAAIEHQLVAGAASQKREIINESGLEVVEVDASGKITKRPGKNYDFRSTIQDTVIKNRISAALPYVNDKSYDQIIKGEWQGPLSEYGNAIREILEGRLKAESLASANDGALKIIFELRDMMQNNDPRFDVYKHHALDIIRTTSSTKDYEKFRDQFEDIFNANYRDMQQEAGKVLDDPDLSSRAALSSREVLQKYRA